MHQKVKYASNMHQICIKYVPNMRQICAKYERIKRLKREFQQQFQLQNFIEKVTYFLGMNTDIKFLSA